LKELKWNNGIYYPSANLDSENNAPLLSGAKYVVLLIKSDLELFP